MSRTIRFPSRRSSASFMADREWPDIKRRSGREHGTFVNDIEDRTLRLTDYSPNDRLST